MVPETTIIPLASSASAIDVINLSSMNGFSGAVSLTCSSTGGVGCSFDNASPNLAAGGSAAPNLTVYNNVSKAGSYNVIVTGEDSTGKYVHTLALEAVTAVLPQGLNLTGPSSLTIINPGDNASGTLIASGQGGVTGSVTFTCSIEGSPSGVTCAANPTSSNITSATATSMVMDPPPRRRPPPPPTLRMSPHRWLLHQRHSQDMPDHPHTPTPASPSPASTTQPRTGCKLRVIPQPSPSLRPAALRVRSTSHVLSPLAHRGPRIRRRARFLRR